ncbi:MAG: histidine kinase [Bacteroidota bacterium]
MEQHIADGLGHVLDSKLLRGDADPKQIEQAKNEWESAVDLMPQIFCVLDADGHILRLNRTVEEWGLNSVEAACGLSLHQLLHPGCSDANCELGRFWPQAMPELRQGRRATHLLVDSRLDCYIEIAVRPSRRTVERAWREKQVFAIALIDDVSEFKQAEMRAERQKEELAARLRQGNEELKEAYEQLRELSAQLVNIQEQERQRIAAELHDGIGQSLSIIKFGIEDAVHSLPAETPAVSREMLQALGVKAKDAIDEVRQITLDLRPSILDDFGIIATIAWLIREFRWFYRDICVEPEITVDEAAIPDALKTTIYRILQEAMNNIAKHAPIARVAIRLGIRQGRLELAIEDSGNGFDVTQVMARSGADKGYGLISMRDRALLSGGNFSIDSLAGTGTLIQVSWPVPE